MSTPVHERLLKDLDQLRHVHGFPPSQVAAKTAKYLSVSTHPDIGKRMRDTIKPLSLPTVSGVLCRTYGPRVRRTGCRSRRCSAARSRSWSTCA
jgi:hypothetical protein